jgi:hypothetical protein
MSIHSKHDMGITNITLVFHQVPPCEHKRGGKRPKRVKIKTSFFNNFNVVTY